MNLGSVRIPGQPSSKAASETLALLQVVGGGAKGVSELIKKLEKVQRHNEQVLTDARLAKQEAEQAQAQANETIAAANYQKEVVQKSRDDLSAQTERTTLILDNRSNQCDSREAKLKTEDADFKAVKRTDAARLLKKEAELTKRIVAVEKRETEYAEMKKSLDKTSREFMRIGEQITQARLGMAR